MRRGGGGVRGGGGGSQPPGHRTQQRKMENGSGGQVGAGTENAVKGTVGTYFIFLLARGFH